MPNLVCLPGLLFAPEVFDAMLRDLGAPGRVLAAPPGDRFDAIVAAQADALTPGTVLIGHSMGAYLALALALRVPGRIAGLVLIGANAAADSDKAAAMRGKVVAWAAKAGMEALGDSIADTMLPAARRGDADLRATLRRMSVGYGIETFRAHQAALADRPDQTARLPELACPVLVLTGSEDTITPPEAGRALAAGVPDGRFHLLDGVGHLPPLECPELLAGHIRAFLDTLHKDCAA